MGDKTFRERLIISHKSHIKNIWDDFVLFTTTAATIEIPLRLALHYPIKGWIYYFDIALISIFGLDLILNFITSYQVGNSEITDPSKIASRYLKGWFILDLLSTLPLDVMLASYIVGYSALIRSTRLIRLFRLVRIAQFMQKLSKTNIFNPAILRMVFLGFWVMIVAHWAACGWIAVGGGNIGPEWTANGYLFYIRSLYWSITTMTTIGYGDVTPVTSTQTIFAMIMELIGAGLYGYVVGSVANLIAKLDVARSHFNERLEKISTFMRFRKIPIEMQHRVQGYYSNLWDLRRGYTEQDVLAELPPSLKLQISLHLNKDIIAKVPIFKGASESLIEQIVINLESIVFTPGDYVFKQGDVGDSMYFISRGSVEVVSKDGKTVYATLAEGNFFGEIALLLSMPRTASIRAVDYIDVYTLSKNKLEHVLDNFPEFKEHIHDLANKRQIELNTPKPAQ